MIYHVQTSVDTRTWTYFHSVKKPKKLLNLLCTRLLKITTPSTSGEEGLADPQVQGCQQEGSKGRSGASKATPNFVENDTNGKSGAELWFYCLVFLALKEIRLLN